MATLADFFSQTLAAQKAKDKVIANYSPYNQAFEGVDWLRLQQENPNLYNLGQNYMSGKYMVQGQLFPTLMADVMKAQTAGDIISQNDIRNRSLGLRAGAADQWRQTQDQFQQAASGEGSVDSGAFGQKLGRAGAAIQAGLQQNIADMASQAAQTNWQYRQQRLQDAQQNLASYLDWKRRKRKGELDMAGDAAAATAAGNAAKWQGYGQAFSGLMGAIGSAYGGGG